MSELGDQEDLPRNSACAFNAIFCCSFSHGDSIKWKATPPSINSRTTVTDNMVRVLLSILDSDVTQPKWTNCGR